MILCPVESWEITFQHAHQPDRTPSILLANSTSSNYYKVFYSRRAARILPLYFSFLVVQTFYQIAINRFWEIEFFDPSINVIYYWLFVQNWVIGEYGGAGQYGPRFLTVTWSLAVEEQFYLLMPFVVRNIKRRQFLLALLIVCYIAGICCRQFLISEGSWRSHYWTVSRADGIWLGAICAVLPKIQLLNVLRSVWILSGCWCAGLLMVISLAIVRSSDSTAMLVAIPFFAFTLYLAVHDQLPSYVKKLLVLPPLVNCGAIAYGLYLFHPVAMFGFFGLIGRNPEIDSVGTAFLMTVAVITSFGAAWLSWRLIESPIIRKIRSFNYSQ